MVIANLSVNLIRSCTQLLALFFRRIISPNRTAIFDTGSRSCSRFNLIDGESNSYPQTRIGIVPPTFDSDAFFSTGWSLSCIGNILSRLHLSSTSMISSRPSREIHLPVWSTLPISMLIPVSFLPGLGISSADRSVACSSPSCTIRTPKTPRWRNDSGSGDVLPV